MSRIVPSTVLSGRFYLVPRPSGLARMARMGRWSEYSLQILDEAGDERIVGDDVHLQTRNLSTLFASLCDCQ